MPVGDFNAPISATAPPRDTTRLFVVERGGTIQVVRNGVKLGTPFLDIVGDVDTSGERGLLSMTFAPDYAQSGLFYVYMVASSPAGEIQIREYRRSQSNPDVADPTGRIVFRATHNQAAIPERAPRRQEKTTGVSRSIVSAFDASRSSSMWRAPAIRPASCS